MDRWFLTAHLKANVCSDVDDVTKPPCQFTVDKINPISPRQFNTLSV